MKKLKPERNSRDSLLNQLQPLNVSLIDVPKESRDKVICNIKSSERSCGLCKIVLGSG